MTVKVLLVALCDGKTARMWGKQKCAKWPRFDSFCGAFLTLLYGLSAPIDQDTELCTGAFCTLGNEFSYCVGVWATRLNSDLKTEISRLSTSSKTKLCINKQRASARRVAVGKLCYGARRLMVATTSLMITTPDVAVVYLSDDTWAYIMWYHKLPKMNSKHFRPMQNRDHIESEPT